ncbi:MAG: flagellar basal body-associated FliL family protein [Gracilimonas sp.]|uniref:flagellar basal body-associated FliL family protein n=1 Tax=Gracilimonas TaxID=649462 RepID=UPI001B13B60F|nr:flagellar basal body-associated FliL family protein [Gracilimonas sp.]MBO6586847.1 flagellar basal body-associated FliL family protein [Gracilimonas sp.]MBO6614665.1 flagellar basal body-associated FliL family protein [Gracilimonas sp.]
MATENKNDQKDKKDIKAKKRKGGPNFLKLGKYFLLVLILVGQGFLAYAIVDKYYPTVFAKMSEKSPSDYGTYQMEEMVVNPANTYGKRYLMVEISLELDDKDHVSLLDENMMKLKQEIIDALSSRNVDQLTRVAGREELRRELSGLINSSIGVRSVRNLYFTKYVMQ